MVLIPIVSLGYWLRVGTIPNWDKVAGGAGIRARTHNQTIYYIR